MSVKASITIDGIAALKPRQIRDAARVAMQAVGDRWISKMLPMHFLQSATAKYGYAPRDPIYRRRKRLGATIAGVSSIREDKPLVWSGRSRELAKQARTEAKAPSSTRATVDVIINAPALNFRYKGSQVNLREEVTRVLPSEVEQLSALFVRVFEQEIERVGRRTTTRRAA